MTRWELLFKCMIRGNRTRRWIFSQDIMLVVSKLTHQLHLSWPTSIWNDAGNTFDDKSTLVQGMVNVVRQQTLTLANIDPDLCCHMALLGHNELSIYIICLVTAVGSALTHLRLDKMAAILADTNFKCIFLNENDRILIEISLKFVPRSPVYNMSHWFRQAITWTNVDPVLWHIYAALGGDWLTFHVWQRLYQSFLKNGYTFLDSMRSFYCIFPASIETTHVDQIALTMPLSEEHKWIVYVLWCEKY